MSKLSICVTVKDRSSIKTERGVIYPFPNLVRSIASSITIDKEIELIIVDWQSTDWSIKMWIEEYIPNTTIHLITVKSNRFSVGRGKNIAAAHATGDILFFVDADMIINKEVIDFALANIHSDVVYYPTVRYYDEHNNYSIHEGGGNFFIRRIDFEKTDKWPEYYAHGFDDVDIYQDISRRYKILTHPTLYIEHQWHPQHMEFKNKFATNEGKKQIEERKEFHLTETEALLVETQKVLHAPNTTHYKLHPIAKGI